MSYLHREGVRIDVSYLAGTMDGRAALGVCVREIECDVCVCV